MKSKIIRIDETEIEFFVHTMVDGYRDQGHIRIKQPRKDIQMLLYTEDLRDIAAQINRLADEVDSSNLKKGE